MDESRQRILESTAIVRLIEGKPGVGKTWFGCELARYELGQPALGINPLQRILFLTFARNAVARIREVFSRQGGCNETERKEFARRVQIDTFCGFFWWLVESYGRYTSNGTTTRLWLVGSRDVSYAPVPDGHEGYTFDKIEAKALELLRIPAVRSLVFDLHPLIIIDEFQDVHDRLFEVIVELGRNSRLVLLRGPGQCIYRSLPGKSFDADVVLKRCLLDLQPARFVLEPIGDDKQRYCSAIRDMLQRFNNDTVEAQVRWPTRILAIERINKKNTPNHLESFVNAITHEMKAYLLTQKVQRPRIAILAGTNLAVSTIFRSLLNAKGVYILNDTTGKYDHIGPQNASLALTDNILLHYGRLMLQLLKTHWIAANANRIMPKDVAALLALLAQEQDRGADGDLALWMGRASLLIDTTAGQKRPATPSGWRGRLERNLSKLNELLRATQKKQKEKGIAVPQRSPFDRGDSALLETLRDEFVDFIACAVNAQGRIDIDRATISFEKVNQQRIIFEKLGIQKSAQVMTIHKSKGREFDGVVLVLEDNRKAIWRSDSAASDEEVEDLYRVAISRAKSAFALVAFKDARENAAEPVRRLLPEPLFADS